MEVLGAAASAVTLLGVAIKGTEVLYRTISSFKDVTSQNESLKSSLKSLQTILTQIKNNPTAFADGEARQLVDNYNKDIARWEKDLRKFQITQSDSKTKQISKKFKGAIRKDSDLLRTIGEITQRCATVGTQLNLINCKTTSALSEKVVELDALSSAQLNYHSTQLDLLRQGNTDLPVIKTGVESVQSSMNVLQASMITAQTSVDTVQASVNTVQEAVMAVTEKMDRIPQVSQEQNENIMTLLTAIQHQVSLLSNQSQPAKLPSHSKPTAAVVLQKNSNHDDATGDEMADDFDLNTCITSLCDLVREREGTIHDEDAEILIDDLGFILHRVSSLANQYPRNCLKRPRDTADKAEDVSKRQFKRLRGLLASSDSVALNPSTPRHRRPTRRRVLRSCNTHYVETRRYNITITMNERRMTTEGNSMDQCTDRTRAIENMMKLKIAERAEFPNVVNAYLFYTQQHNRTTLLNPIISTGRTIPNDSKVFRIVESGNVDELRLLLNERQCSLRDRNEAGTPLLHFATKNFTMCQYLIDCGADIDEISRISGFDSLYYPLAVQLNDSEKNENDLSGIIACRRLLLDAGADPTLAPYYDDNNGLVWTAWTDSLYIGTEESLRVMLDFGSSFIDLEEKDEMGRTSLLQLAHFMGYGYASILEKFALLLDRGANLHAQDDMGDTCLHIAIWNARHRLPQQELNAIALLIRRGADIFVTNWEGESVFELAYACCCENFIGCNGGYRGDMWDAALARCGLETHIRKPEERKSCYTKTYTREDFEKLWEGYEYLCPYYSEPLIPCDCVRIGEVSDEEIEDKSADEHEEEQAEESPDTEDEPIDTDPRQEAYLSDSEEDEFAFGASGGVMLEENVETTRGSPT